MPSDLAQSRRHLRLCAALLLFFPLALVSAAPNIQVSRQTYAVRGDNAAALREDITRNRRNGWDGYTDWQVNWRYRFEERPGSCGLAAIEVQATVRVSLPEWRAEQPKRRLEQRWSRYISALQEHEQGHVENAQRGAQAVDSALRGLAPQRDCGAMGKLADATCQRVLERVREWDRQYDARTEHGRTQGAVFP